MGGLWTGWVDSGVSRSKVIDSVSLGFGGSAVRVQLR